MNMNHMKKINRIVAYGCSYTVGDEIMDHDVLRMTFAECNGIKHKYLNTGGVASAWDGWKTGWKDALKLGIMPPPKQFKIDYRTDRWHSYLHRQMSWAGQLAKRLHVQFENRAVIGSGLDEHYFKIYNDFQNGKINDNDLVLCGLTNYHRIIDFRTNRYEPANNTLISYLIPNEEGSRLFLELFNNDFMIYQYCKNIHLLHCLGSKMNLLMQPMQKEVILDHIIGLDIPETKQYAESIWNECASSFLSKLYLSDEYPRCGFGHPSLESHTLLAEQLEDLVRDKFQLL